MIYEVERNLLSSILIESEIFNRVKNKITTNHFNNAKHKDIYRAMLELDEEEKGIDITLVMQRCKFANLSDLCDIAQAHYTSVGFEDYIKELQEHKFKVDIKKELLKLQDIEKLNTKEVLEIKSNLEEIRLEAEVQYEKSEDIFDRVYELAEDLVKNPNQLRGLRTKIQGLDTLLGGLKKDNLIIVGARPGMGKTALGLNIANNIAEQNKKVMFISLEMGGEELMQRLISINALIDSKSFNGRFLHQDFQKLFALKEDIKNRVKPMAIIDYNPKLEDILYMFEKMREEKNLPDLLVIDYLTLIQTKKSFNSRTLEVGHISRTLKLLAKKYKIPVLCLAQLNRGNAKEKREPMVCDLRDSGEIEQDADSIILIHEEEGQHKLIVAKNRHGGNGIVNIKFEKKYSMMKELDKQSLGF